MSLKTDYPNLFQFLAGYFPDSDFDNLTDQQVVSNYVSDSIRSETGRNVMEMVKLEIDSVILDIQNYWIDVSSDSNLYFEDWSQARSWLVTIKEELIKLTH